MSGTRSHYPPAPAINPADSALVLGWYGSRNDADHARMDAHVRDLVHMFDFASGCSIPLMLGADAGFFPRIEGVRHVVVLPVFMCEGRTLGQRFPTFLRQIEAQQAGASIIHTLPIIGGHQSLAQLVAERAAKHLNRGPGGTKLVLVAHGSTRDQGSVVATQTLRDRIRKMAIFSAVHDAYLEASPDPADLVSGMAGDCVIEGLFLTEGRHSTHDLESRIPGRASRCLGAIGIDPRFVDVLSAAVGDAIPSPLAA